MILLGFPFEPGYFTDIGACLYVQLRLSIISSQIKFTMGSENWIGRQTFEFDAGKGRGTV